MEASEFQGRIGRYHHESEAWWPPDPRPPQGAPNVLVIVLDDVGYAQLGCFGSDIDTPTFDRLAAGGLRYANFHTTALCSPTRACVLTGRNHHRVGMGRIVDLATGFPGYDARIADSCAMAPAMLTPHGYAAWAVGKWHLTPEDEEHLGATRARWPLGKGFERWYGFFPGETHQFVPALHHDNHAVDPPGTYEDGYHLTTDLVDRSIEYVEDLRNVDVDKPWFLYLAPGACHSPHQTPPGWIERYAGRFDQGWDEWRTAALAKQKAEGLLPEHAELSPRPDWVPAWADLSDQERRVYARYMEAFAAFLTHTDHEVGRLIDRLAALGELDDTLVVLLSDNGASSEGGPTGSLNDARVWNALPRTAEEADERLDEIGGPRIHNNYPWGWTVAGNTPFRRWKRETHEGGVADPLIVHWPNGIPTSARGTVRHQYVHAIDVLPTLLDAIGLDAPEAVGGVAQVPLDGVSFASTFASDDAPEVHTVQYSEMLGCRAMYRDGMKAVTYHEVQVDEPGLEHAPWELYDLRADPSECHDLAGERPDELAELIDLWWSEAERHQVLPLDNRPFSELVFQREASVRPRNRYRYFPGRAPVPESVAVNTRARAHAITAHVTVADDHTGAVEGVLAVQGSVLGGWSFHLLAGTSPDAPSRLVYVHNLAGWRLYRVEAEVPPLGAGDHALGFSFDPPHARLLVDGVVVGEGEVRRTVWSRFSLTGAGLTAGWSPDFSPADEDYRGRFAFTATLHHVDIDVPGDPVVDADAEADAIIASQ
ncbi:MAG: sulfatase-like hydrolase/transferase [Acidimicrobiales bacterium]|nr:sulfatase-like hydrolase/transferase [Acidimicrobiales bacterium]HRW37959.1 sulfatase-like hydrolase/transferase [Aquihabitans sp.]